MWSVWLVFCDCGFHSVYPLMDKDKRLMEASWWERLTKGETQPSGGSGCCGEGSGQSSGGGCCWSGPCAKKSWSGDSQWTNTSSSSFISCWAYPSCWGIWVRPLSSGPKDPCALGSRSPRPLPETHLFTSFAIRVMALGIPKHRPHVPLQLLASCCPS